MDNAAHAQHQAEAQQRELALLREQINSHKRSTIWAMMVGAALISLAIFLR